MRRVRYSLRLSLHLTTERQMPLLHETTRKAAQLAESEIAEIAEKLSKQIAGDVRMDRYSRLMYSTDASMYQMTPVAVVVPRSADDALAALLVAREHGVPVLPRGGGTALAGQTCNHAIVIDFSKHMRGVLEVSPEERWARVQPGIVNNHLSAAVRQHGLMYGPDPGHESAGDRGRGHRQQLLRAALGDLRQDARPRARG